MRKPVLFAAGALALAGLLAPASAATPLTTSQVYFHCPSDVKVINASPISDGAVTGWDAIAPTASVTSGAGCGFAETGPLQGTGMQTVYDFPGAGTFTGDLDKLTFQFHVLDGATRSTLAGQSLDLRLTIDGQSMFGTEADGNSSAVTVPVTLVPSATGASSLAEVTVTGLNFLTPPDAKDTTPVEHAITFAASMGSEVLTGFVMDTTETPSGITFNPAKEAAAKVRATTPGPIPVAAEEE